MYEVQDLPHAVLLLLTKIGEQSLFLSGDSAQNISQGVGFRFCELSSVFQPSRFIEEENKKILPTVHFLTVKKKF